MFEVQSSQKENIKGKTIFNTQLINQENIINEKSLKENEKNEKDKDEINIFIKNIIAMKMSELRETFYKEYIQFQHRINDSIQSYSQNLKNISLFEKRLIEQYTDVKIKTDKIEIILDKLSKDEDKITTYEIRFNNLLRDFKESVNKYDDLFLDNMNVPGKIGIYSKFKNIREFLSYTYDKIEHFDLIKESNISKIKNNQEQLNKFIKKINCEIKLLRDECMQITSKNLSYIEKKFNDEFKEIKKKFDIIQNESMLFDLDKKINTLMENYNDLKNIKDYIYEKIAKIENDIIILKVHKTPKNNTFNIKKDTKLIFSNLSDNKSENKITEENINPKKRLSNSSKTLNKNNPVNININKSLFQNSNYLKTQQSVNLDNINEEFDENNDNDPLNKMAIKSVKISSHRKKTYTSENSIYLNDKSSMGGANMSFKDNPSFNSHSLEDSSCNFDKKENIEDIIDENKLKKEKNGKNSTEIKRNNYIGDKIELYVQNNTINNNFNQVNKIKNSKKKKKRNNIISIKSKLKMENSLLNEKSNTISKINIKRESSNSLATEEIIHEKNDLINIKNDSDDKNFQKIHLYKNNTNELNSDDNNIKNIKNNINIINNNEIGNIKTNSFNIEIFNNNVIKKHLSDSSKNQKYKTIIKTYKSYEYPKINNKSEKPFIPKAKFNTLENNIKNKEFPNKKIYTIYKMESLKKEELKRNNNPTIINQQNIPIITNFSKKITSNSEKKLKKAKRFTFKGKIKEKNINLEMKKIPSNFNKSKKIKVNHEN